MEAAKQAVSKLTSQHGKHTTEVSEHYKPAIVHEQINPVREVEETTVVDKEIHQEHFHTSILPIQDKQVLPTGKIFILHTRNLKLTLGKKNMHTTLLPPSTLNTNMVITRPSAQRLMLSFHNSEIIPRLLQFKHLKSRHQ